MGAGRFPWTMTLIVPLIFPSKGWSFEVFDDGSFDPGDELCWYAPSLEGWN